jgi:cysteine-rich repeat protein
MQRVDQLSEVWEDGGGRGEMSELRSLMILVIALFFVGAIGCSGDGNDGGEVCGDGVVDTGEECEDGNEIDDDECTNDCMFPPTEVMTVCELENPSGILCGGDCTFNHDEYANWYCQLAGFSSAVSFTVLTEGNVTCPYYDADTNPVLSECSQLIGPGGYGLDPTCDAITDLLCD